MELQELDLDLDLDLDRVGKAFRPVRNLAMCEVGFWECFLWLRGFTNYASNYFACVVKGSARIA